MQSSESTRSTRRQRRCEGCRALRGHLPEINPRCRAAVEAYAATLSVTGMDTFEARTMEDIITVMDRELRADWVAVFRERYLTPR